MIKRDDRYDVVKTMYGAGHIGLFKDIFKYIPKTVVANDLGKKVDRFNKLMSRLDEFTLKDMYTIGSFCGLTERQIYELVEAEYLHNKSKIKKVKKT
ncbi:MAG: hypothetical protein JST68_19645 [Bacteroidetes bacterium]|nr:hypothetical protein [Bacteroidota bacterium]